MCNQHTVQLSDEQLIRNFQDNRTDCVLEVLYKRYFQKVFFYCLRIIDHREDALDVAGAVFLKLIENLDRLRETANFQQWLFRIARNEAFDHCHKQQKTRAAPRESFLQLADSGPGLQESREREENFKRMQAAFDALPQESRLLLKAKYFDGESIETLTKRYRSTGSAIKMRLARARRKANENYSGA